MILYVQRATFLVLFSLLVVILSGCGGGGGGSSASAASSVNATPTGVWDGTFTENGVGAFAITGIISGNQLVFISLDGGAIYEGTISVNGTSFTATTTDYAIGGEVFSTSNLSGTIQRRSSITGTYTSSNGATGSFSLTYDSVTDRGSSLSVTDGNWTATDVGVTLTFSIISTGDLTGSDTDGCIYNGTVNIIDASVNIYRLTIAVSSCGIFNGAYTGYGVVTDTTVVNDTLIFTVSNPNLILVGSLARA